MTEDVYERLAEALDRLPNGFPRTPSRVEIPLLRKIFSEEEASLAGRLSDELEGVETIAERVGLSPQEAGGRLAEMAQRGLVWFDDKAGPPQFRLAPFVVGILEDQLDNMDHELAHLIEHYLAEGGAEGIMRPRPAIHRVVPAQGAVKSEWVLPYDDVRAILEGAKTFYVRDCVCRAQKEHIGRRCDSPLKMCMIYSTSELPTNVASVSKEEALALLDRAEEIGLVHTVSNVQSGSLLMRDLGYICNCCGCCCLVLRGITEWGIENSVAQVSYYAHIDPNVCLECGTCIERCHVSAIAEQDGSTVVQRQRCIGCGLCVTACPSGAATLQRKPEAEIVHPPLDLPAWERERRRNREATE